MHTVTELETNVPAFLGKLWKLVEDPETDDLICWSPNGRSFFIRNQAQFARELLPHYYKHNNMASFVRQLNMYGFHKKVSVDLGGLKCDKDEMEFAHQYFIKGHSYLLEHIKRKIASTKTGDSSHQPLKPEVMSKLLSEVRTMRGRQENMDSRFGAMKRENEALWRELAMLRRKHLKQQEIVNKLIHFLVTLVQPTRGGGLPVKRRYPLMIDNTNHNRCKHSKMSKPEASPTGPVIHELDASEHDFDSQYIVGDIFENSNPAVHSPETDTSGLDIENLETVELMENAMRTPEYINIDALCPHEIPSKTKLKGKKKRKNKLPVKIHIPATETGEEAREEILMLEVNPEGDQPIPIALTENTSSQKKPVPSKSLRSSKLAAMAANINKENNQDQDSDHDADSSEEVDDVDPRQADYSTSISEVLSMPDPVIDFDNEQEANTKDSADSTKINSSNWKNLSGTMNWNKKSNDQTSDNRNINDSTNLADSIGQNDSERATGNNGNSSKSKDLSLRCVSPSGKSDNNFREDMDIHLESMQNDLENLREVLRNEGYSIDANTLLGLFGADDPMSFGIPVNPELDPRTQRDRGEELERLTENSNFENAGGELMAYTPSTSLLDFDDDIFLGAGEASPSGTIENTNPNTYYNADDSIDLEDSKVSLLASLEAANNANTTNS